MHISSTLQRNLAMERMLIRQAGLFIPTDKIVLIAFRLNYKNSEEIMATEYVANPIVNRTQTLTVMANIHLQHDEELLRSLSSYLELDHESEEQETEEEVKPRRRNAKAVVEEKPKKPIVISIPVFEAENQLNSYYLNRCTTLLTRMGLDEEGRDLETVSDTDIKNRKIIRKRFSALNALVTELNDITNKFSNAEVNASVELQDSVNDMIPSMVTHKVNMANSSALEDYRARHRERELEVKQQISEIYQWFNRQLAKFNSNEESTEFVDDIIGPNNTVSEITIDGKVVALTFKNVMNTIFTEELIKYNL